MRGSLRISLFWGNATDGMSNEITAIPELVALRDLRGAVVSIDAMGCQKNITRCIVDKGADYIFGLKGNQPTLRQELLAAFDDATCARLRDTPELRGMGAPPTGLPGQLRTRTKMSPTRRVLCFFSLGGK